MLKPRPTSGTIDADAGVGASDVIDAEAEVGDGDANVETDGKTGNAKADDAMRVRVTPSMPKAESEPMTPAMPKRGVRNGNAIGAEAIKPMTPLMLKAHNLSQWHQQR